MALVKTSPLHPALWLQFASMDARGFVVVDDASDPARLSFDLKSAFRLGPDTNGINPLAEQVMIHLQYGSIVGPMYIVSVPAGCFAQVGKGYRVVMQDMQACGASIQMVNGPNEVVNLGPAVDRFDLRLTPGPKDGWDLKLNIDFLASTPNGPNAGVIAILRSPTMVKLAIGNDNGVDGDGDGGAVTIGKIEFSGTDPQG